MDFVCSKGQGWFEFIHYVLGALKIGEIIYKKGKWEIYMVCWRRDRKREAVETVPPAKCRTTFYSN